MAALCARALCRGGGFGGRPGGGIVARLLSGGGGDEAAPQQPPTYRVAGSFVNRNPRNLEHSGHAPKPKGWELQQPYRQYYLKCVLRRTNAGTVAQIVHHTGAVVVQASTDEAAIGSQLYSPRDVSAARAVGDVLARRCLQCGVHRVHLDDELAAVGETPRGSERRASFRSAMAEAGVQLTEPPELEPPAQPGVDYDALTGEQRAALFPRLVDELRTAEDKATYVQYAPTMRPAKGQEREQKYQALAKVRRGWWWSYRRKRLLPPPNPSNPFV